MGLIDWTDEQLEDAGLDKKKVESIVKRFLKLDQEMRKQGLSIYAANGTGFLIHSSRPTHSERGEADTDSTIAQVGTRFDGGDW